MTYLPGGRPGGRPGLAGALEEREKACKLDSVDEEDEEAVERPRGERERVEVKRREPGARVTEESEEKVALPRAAAWEQAASSREETRLATRTEEGPRWRILAARAEVDSKAQRRFREGQEKEG